MPGPLNPADEALRVLKAKQALANAAWVGSILAAGGVFLLFYSLLGDAIWISAGASCAALLGLWFALLDPLQRNIARLKSDTDKVEARKRMIRDAEAKVAALRKTAQSLKSRGAAAGIQSIAHSVEEAVAMLKERPDQVDLTLAEKLITLFLDRTVQFVNHYSAMTLDASIDALDENTVKQAEEFISKLDANFASVVSRLDQMEKMTHAVGVETEMSTLQVLFDVEGANE